MKVFGKKFKKALGSLGEFLYDVISVFSLENIRETDKLLYELSNPFTLKDYEILISGDYEVCSILKSLRKKAGISGDIILGRNISLENVIRRLVHPTPKEKVEYIRALREAASGKFDTDKYTIRRMKSNVGSGVTFKGFSVTGPDGIERVLYDKDKGIGVEDIDFKKVFRYKGTLDSEIVENTYCKLYEPEEKGCKNPQRKCKNCSVYNGFKGSGRL